MSIGLKILIDAPMKYIWGNFTYFSQLPCGAVCLADGGCATIDAIYCINPVARPFFISGAIANTLGGCCMLGSFGLGYICVPAALAVGGAGVALRRVGKYAVATGNMLEPKPTLTKMTSPVGAVIG
jgi:hypothetical protein